MLEHRPIALRSSPTNERWEIKRYTSMEEFKTLNPNCCEVQPLVVDFPPEYYDFTLEGKAYRYVIVNYMRYYVANAKREPDYWTKYIVFDNCGDLKTLHELEKMR